MLVGVEENACAINDTIDDHGCFNGDFSENVFGDDGGESPE